MFLTHLDEEGNDSPAILIENSTAANRAVNIPEFVNIPPDGLVKIDTPAVDMYTQVRRSRWSWGKKVKYEAAIAEVGENYRTVDAGRSPEYKTISAPALAWEREI